MSPWRILNTGLGEPAWNMAVDEAILLGVLAGTSRPTVRFYDWAPPTVSLGYHQEADKEVDPALVRAQGWALVRRPTGGRAVLHRNEVTYAVIAPTTGRLAGGVNESYAAISEALAAGLQKLGVAAELQRGSLSAASQREPANPCFASTSRYELSVHGRKISGSAQVRREGALLQHGSILLKHDQSAMALLLPGFDDEKRVKVAAYLARKTICISQAAEREVAYDEAVAALSDGFAQAWPEAGFVIGDLQPEELARAAELVNTRYAADSWNARK